MTIFERFRILPLLVLVAAVSFGIRFSEFIGGEVMERGAAYAQQAEMSFSNLEPAAGDAEHPPEEELSAAHESGQGGHEEEEADPSMAIVDEGLAATSDTIPEEGWKDSLDTDIEYSGVQMELFEDLSRRRKELQERDREQAVREALLKAAEQELDQKYRELTSLKKEIEDLLQKQTEEEEQRIASLVKIYEGMKAKDAARIFNTLEMGVLLQVMSQMSERKSAPIIAAMNPERARSVTILLAEQKQLPDLSQTLGP